MRRGLWWAPNLHLKARSRDNDNANSCYDDNIFGDHEIDDYMAYTAFNMTIFQQLRHALTRHDPKTYFIWLVQSTLRKLKE